MKSVDEHAREIRSDIKADMMLNVIALINQRDFEIRKAMVLACLAIVQHHNVNLMSGETAKQSIIKALMTMVEGEK